MTDSLSATYFGDGRLGLVDGAFEIVVGVDASPGAVEAAHRAALERFRTIPEEIDCELDALRAPAQAEGTPLSGAVARRMWRAVRPLVGSAPVAPIAALTGAVAEEILMAAVSAATLDRVYVSFAGSIALHLTPGYGFRAGLVETADGPSVFATADIRPGDMIRGIGLAGRGDRTGSPGAADAVTVFGQTAAKAAAAASVIAAATDVLPDAARSAGEARWAAVGIRSSSPGFRAIPDADVRAALSAGEAVADALRARGLISAAALHLAGETVISGNLPTAAPEPPAARRAGGRR